MPNRSQVYAVYVLLVNTIARSYRCSDGLLEVLTTSKQGCSIPTLVEMGNSASESEARD